MYLKIMINGVQINKYDLFSPGPLVAVGRGSGTQLQVGEN